MQNDISFCMQEEMKPRIKYRRQGKKSYLARRRWCVAGLAVSLAVLRWRPVAVLWLTDGVAVQAVKRERFLPLPLSSGFFVFFFLCFIYPWLSLCPLDFVFKKHFPPRFQASPYSFLSLSISFLSLARSLLPLVRSVFCGAVVGGEDNGSRW